MPYFSLAIVLPLVSTVIVMVYSVLSRPHWDPRGRVRVFLMPCQDPADWVVLSTATSREVQRDLALHWPSFLRNVAQTCLSLRGTKRTSKGPWHNLRYLVSVLLIQTTYLLTTIGRSSQSESNPKKLLVFSRHTTSCGGCVRSRLSGTWWPNA
jgi:hypothetical protein